ncbi:MAG: hypothetical protein CSB48_06720 [Proteobacteria bacterium]|nr:MAG: hypothetical protein CSB48_06720 [Pseudomonadota bacterium]
MPRAVWGDFVDRLDVQGEVTFVDLNRAFDTEQWLSYLDARVNEPAVWLGWSLGGMLALAAAQAFPDKCLGLALINSTPCFVKKTDWPCGQPPGMLENMEKLVNTGSSSLIRRFSVLQTLGSPEARADSRLLQAMIDGHDAVYRREVLLAGLRLLGDLDLRRAMAGLPVPLKIILGSEDNVVLASQEGLTSVNPDVSISVVNGMGHLPFMYFAARVAGELSAFVRSFTGESA